MRYAPSLPPLPSPVEGEELEPVRAVRPVRPVEPRTRVPRVVQRFGAKTEPGRGAGGSPAMSVEKRATSDRRGLCRRLQHGQPFLDTRSTEDRRKNKRRDSDIVTTLDEEV